MLCRNSIAEIVLVLKKKTQGLVEELAVFVLKTLRQ
jgi:hypothetical protein